ncbi:MAG: EamA family transporter [Proteobacteria bacterium]|jgi:drug/metabolite transporter (DMT)-like permease|nr:EamA family transporter [Pseudomonadota bacterium]
MRPRDVIELLFLSLLWGGAYLFTRAAVPAFGPAPLVSMRLGIAALILLPIVFYRGGWPQLRASPRALFMVGVPFTALPFMLMTWGALHITAGLSAVLNATAPMFAALVAHFVLKERLGAWRAGGLLLGFVGVLILMSSGNVSLKTAEGPLAVLAVLGTAMIWSVGATYTRRKMAGTDAMVTTAGSLAAASLFLAPLAWATWPSTPPSARAWAEMAFLGIASSGLGMWMYFRLLRRIGTVPAMSVTFLSPLVAMVSGALYLGEAITLQMVAGCAVVLLGTALSLGLIGRGSAKQDTRAEA